MTRIKRSYKADQIKSMQFESVELTETWRDSFGVPSLSGSWIIYGDSSNGKTSFMLQLAKELCKHKSVAFNLLEEGVRLSIQTKLFEFNVTSDHNISFLKPETLEDLRIRLSKRRSPEIIIIDSIQYFMRSDEDPTPITLTDYWKLIHDFPDKLFIFNSHSDGKYPFGAVAKKIRYHSDVKIRVDHHVAFISSRYGGNKPYIIWEDEALKHWPELFNEQIQ